MEVPVFKKYVKSLSNLKDINHENLATKVLLQQYQKYRQERSILIVYQIMNKPPVTIFRNNLNSEFDVQTNTDAQGHVTINEQIILTKDQFELLKIISNAHDKSISEYIQKALLESMKAEIEFGDFCDILLDKLDPERELL